MDNDPLFTTIEYFSEIESAIDGGVGPCDASTPICGDYGPGYPQQLAALGGPAARGDNCTPYNNYSVGLSIPGAQPTTPSMGPNTLLTPTNGPGTIVNQTIIALDNVTVLGTGSQPIGWFLTTQNSGTWFVPDANLSFGIAAVSVPAAIKISFSGTNSKALMNSVRGILNAYANYLNTPLSSTVLNLIPMGNSTPALQACFSAPLNPYT